MAYRRRAPGLAQAKRRRETGGGYGEDRMPTANCIHCSLPFAIGAGVITDEVALCDICSGD